MESPTVHTFDEDKIRELIKNCDPYLCKYIQALQRVSDGWKRLTQEGLTKIRELSNQLNKEN